MRDRIIILQLYGWFVFVLPLVVLANFQEVQPGVFLDDFQAGMLAQLKPGGIKPPQSLQLVERKGHTVLRLIGDMQSVALYDGPIFRDFTFEVDLEKGLGNKGYAGWPCATTATSISR